MPPSPTHTHLHVIHQGPVAPLVPPRGYPRGKVCKADPLAQLDGQLPLQHRVVILVAISNGEDLLHEKWDGANDVGPVASLEDLREGA